jgi:hypothetical protein
MKKPQRNLFSPFAVDSTQDQAIDGDSEKLIRLVESTLGRQGIPKSLKLEHLPRRLLN